MGDRALDELAIDSARDALGSGNVETAWEWLNAADKSIRPAALVADCLDRRSLAAGDRG